MVSIGDTNRNSHSSAKAWKGSVAEIRGTWKAGGQTMTPLETFMRTAEKLFKEGGELIVLQTNKPPLSWNGTEWKKSWIGNCDLWIKATRRSYFTNPAEIKSWYDSTKITGISDIENGIDI